MIKSLIRVKREIQIVPEKFPEKQRQREKKAPANVLGKVFAFGVETFSIRLQCKSPAQHFNYSMRK